MRKPSSLNRSVFDNGPEPSIGEVTRAAARVVDRAFRRAGQTAGVMLSAGVDSTLLLSLSPNRQTVATFTVVNREDHPDLLAAQRLAKEWGLQHSWMIPSATDITEARAGLAGRQKVFEGDDAVYFACKFASRAYVRCLVATDGIDELAGGYWWHANTSERFSDQAAAFEYFWARLWENHMFPLLESAEAFGLTVEFPFLDDEFVDVFVRIPFEVRAAGGQTKKFWKQAALGLVPQWILEREKIGFVSALSWSNKR